MLTVEQVTTTLPIDSEGNVYMDLFNCSISPDGFIARFGDSDLTYTSLAQNVNTTEGWRQQFESWRDTGIIPA